MTVNLPDSTARTHSKCRIFGPNIAVANNSIDPTLLANYQHLDYHFRLEYELPVRNKLFWKSEYIRHSVELNIKRRFNYGLTKRSKVMPNCQISTLGKSSCSACLM